MLSKEGKLENARLPWMWKTKLCEHADAQWSCDLLLTNLTIIPICSRQTSLWKRQKAACHKSCDAAGSDALCALTRGDLSIFLLLFWCHSVDGELFEKKSDNARATEKPLTGKCCLQIYLPYPFLPSPSISLSSCKSWSPGYKNHFCFSAPPRAFSTILFSSLSSLAFLTLYIFLSKLVCVCVCQWERGRFVLYWWADMVNKPCLSVCLFSNNESVSQSATQSVNLQVSELSHSY